MKILRFGVLITLATSLSVIAGERGGNGGGVHVCKESVELYDFYEGKSPLAHNLKLWDFDPKLTVDDYLLKAINRLKKDTPLFGQYIEVRLNELRSIPYDELVLPKSIPYIGDSDVPFVDEDCEYKNVGNWNERIDRVFFSKRLFERMNAMNQAGLYIHEVLYKIARESGIASNSDKVREVVAKMFSYNGHLSESELRRTIKSEIIPIYADENGRCELSVNLELPKLEVDKFKYAYSEIALAGYLPRNPAKSVLLENGEILQTTSNVLCQDLRKHGMNMITSFRLKEYATYSFNVDVKITWKVNGRKMLINNEQAKTKVYQSWHLFEGTFRENISGNDFIIFQK